MMTPIVDGIRRKEREEALNALKRMKEILAKVDMERVVEHIREDRVTR